jgi:ribosomal protein S27E
MPQLMALDMFKDKSADWWKNRSNGRRVQCPGCRQGAQVYVVALPGSFCMPCGRELQVLTAPAGTVNRSHRRRPAQSEPQAGCSQGENRPHTGGRRPQDAPVVPRGPGSGNRGPK